MAGVLLTYEKFFDFCLALTLFCLASKKKGKRRSKETPTSSKKGNYCSLKIIIKIS